MRTQIKGRWSRRFVLGMLAGTFTITAGCTVGREFREAAGPAVQSGVTQIVNGLLDGLFAAIEPEATTDDYGG